MVTLTKIRNSHYLVAFAMICSAYLAYTLTPQPTKRDGKSENLEKVIPRQFGNWVEDTSITPLHVSPDIQAELSKFYVQTLSRTYINQNGKRVMLSLALGGDQTRALQVHKPEVCYKAQGFEILDQIEGTITINGDLFPVMRLFARQDKRIEPITYWIRIGDDTARGWYEQNLMRLKYGLQGKIPDGLLFRVSSLAIDKHEAYELHAVFINELIQNMDAKGREFLLGKSTF